MIYVCLYVALVNVREGEGEKFGYHGIFEREKGGSRIFRSLIYNNMVKEDRSDWVSMC